ncbi:hypothetical protein CP02DC18_1279 [Chlamydia psittaci 02DC18]|nr:hypothetical protein CP02DC18_1279 [Chlamydia psittaci 02DC18]
MSLRKPAQGGQNRFEPVWSVFSRSKPLYVPLSAGLGRPGPV